METTICFIDGTSIAIEVSPDSPLAEGLTWNATIGTPRPKAPVAKRFTVIGVYTEGEERGERFADYVDAESWQDAEQQAKATRGAEVMIAAVLEGEHFCQDEQ